MSIASEIQRIKTNIANAYTTAGNKSATLPQNQNSANLANAINSIPTGRDWSEVGYSNEPDVIDVGVEHAKEIMQNWDSSQTDHGNEFNGDTQLIFMPLVNTSNVTRCNNMFRDCYRLIYIPQLNTASVKQMGYTFYDCYALTRISQLNTSSVENMGYTFYNCIVLAKIPQINMEKVKYLANTFTNCTALTELGGFVNLGQSYVTTTASNYSGYTLDLSSSTLLTHDSLMNVINNLYDIATRGCNAQQLVLGSTNLAKLTAEEIAIATNKGWTVL